MRANLYLTVTKPREEAEAESRALKAQEALKAAQATPAVVQAQTPVLAASQSFSGGDAKLFIYMQESGNRTDAINSSSGACGLGQALPCSKMGCSLSDYACQDAFFTSYMQNRYGTWENAAAFWRSHSWW